jgi:hypothetical protein
VYVCIEYMMDSYYNLNNYICYNYYKMAYFIITWEKRTLRIPKNKDKIRIYNEFKLLII